MTAAVERTPLDLTLDLPDEAATQRFGRALAAHLGPGDVIALWGELGAGKTALARAIIRSLDPNQPTVPSPTFTLVQIYELPDFILWHCDFYRLSTAEEIAQLGLDEAFAEGVTLIEWPDRLGPDLPPGRLDVMLSFGTGEESRSIRLKGDMQWAARLADLADE